MDEDTLSDKTDIRHTQSHISSQPTLSDNTGVDRLTLPKAMQIKNFGKKGQTKYTHLVDQDTSRNNANKYNNSNNSNNSNNMEESTGYGYYGLHKSKDHSSSNYKKQRIN